MTIYGEGGGGVIQFADNADNRVGQILYYHAENSMSFRVNGNQTRLKINSDGDVCIGNSGNPPWTETGGSYNNISISDTQIDKFKKIRTESFDEVNKDNVLKILNTHSFTQND